MRIIATAREIMDIGSWDKFCELTGMSEWAMAEGQLDSSEEFSFSEEDALTLGLIKQRSYSEDD